MVDEEVVSVADTLKATLEAAAESVADAARLPWVAAEPSASGEPDPPAVDPPLKAAAPTATAARIEAPTTAMASRPGPLLGVAAEAAATGDGPGDASEASGRGTRAPRGSSATCTMVPSGCLISSFTVGCPFSAVADRRRRYPSVEALVGSRPPGRPTSGRPPSAALPVPVHSVVTAVRDVSAGRRPGGPVRADRRGRYGLLLS